MKQISRRSFLISSAASVGLRAQPPLIVLVGDFIAELFIEVLKIGIEMLIKSVAKYLWDRYLSPRATGLTATYVESAHAADNFCPYCTVEFARNQKIFWDGAFFQPNEENNFYRAQSKPTDQVLMELLNNNDWLWHLDSSRNRNAHVSGRILEQIRSSVQQLEQNKIQLYHQIETRVLPVGGLSPYMIQKPILDELDKAFRHVTSTDPRNYHINPMYTSSVVMLQKYVTWLNTRLSAVETATFKGGLLA